MSVAPSRLFIEFLTAEGFVVRILGLIERRGFILKRVSMAEQPDGRHATIALEIEARDQARSLGVLARQLERLHGVSQVSHEGSFFFQGQAA